MFDVTHVQCHSLSLFVFFPTKVRRPLVAPGSNGVSLRQMLLHAGRLITACGFNDTVFLRLASSFSANTPACRRCIQVQSELSSFFLSPRLLARCYLERKALSNPSSVRAIKRWPPFSRSLPKKNGWILVMNIQNSWQRGMRMERHISSLREVRRG